MRYTIRKYFSGFCTYEVEANNEEIALQIANNSPLDYHEICSNLEEWKECDEIEPNENN